MKPLRVGIDGGALRRPETGIGRYTSNVIDEVARLLEEEQSGSLAVWANAFGGQEGVTLPEGARLVNPGFPDRLLRSTWRRLNWPAVDVLSGGLDVFHTSDWVHPPLRRAAAVTTVHDIGALVHPEWYAPDVAGIHETKNRLAAEKADRIIAISEFTRRSFLERFPISPDRVVVVPNGVSPEFRPASQERLAEVRE